MGVKRHRIDRIALSIEFPEALGVPSLAHSISEHVPSMVYASRIERRGKAEMRCDVRVAYLSEWLKPRGDAGEENA